ncbi:DUF3391 domain-containing protein [Rhizobium sp. AN69]|uniref:DUF3391 domain-containing protein n=1 Tax=Rhizobium sp. AN69 TaxID=3035213 RepID=UPI003A5989B8
MKCSHDWEAERSMLRRIKPEQVRLGMFVEAVDGNWSGQKFWRSRFLLDSPRDLEILRASSVDGVIINTFKKGCPPFSVEKECHRIAERAGRAGIADDQTVKAAHQLDLRRSENGQINSSRHGSAGC